MPANFSDSSNSLKFSNSFRFSILSSFQLIQVFQLYSRFPTLLKSSNSLRFSKLSSDFSSNSSIAGYIHIHFSGMIACPIRERSFPNLEGAILLVVRIRLSPKITFNFSALYVSMKRTRQAMCSDPTSLWYNGIASLTSLCFRNFLLLSGIFFRILLRLSTAPCGGFCFPCSGCIIA